MMLLTQRLMLLSVMCGAMAALLCMCTYSVGASYASENFGWPECENRSLQRSGYIEIPGVNGTRKNIFYWLFGPRNPADDGGPAPVVLWLSGGPGCSDFVGIGLNVGPCLMNETEGGGLYHNPYGWNDKAYTLFVDQPVGTGYSYATPENYIHNTSQMSEDMYHFLQSFVKSFHQPDISRESRLYIVGESYSGRLSPLLGNRILQGNAARATTGAAYINLRGVIIGNGFTSPYAQMRSVTDMVHQGCIEKIGQPCVTAGAHAAMMRYQTPCLDMIAKCNEQPTDEDESCILASTYCDAHLQPYVDTGRYVFDVRRMCQLDECSPKHNSHAFMRNETVMAALGAAEGIQWISCNLTIANDFMRDSMRNFNYTIPPLLEAGVPVLVYAGDVDVKCNWMGIKAWMTELIWPGQAEFNAAPDEEFNVSGRPAGTERVHGNLSFIRVYDAGHLVPMYQPEVALYMLNRFLNRQTM